MPVDVDWNAAWKQEQQARGRVDDAARWDQRAPGYAKTAGTSSYAEQFIQRAHIERRETVFDMGCGSGTLALPLARAGHHVYACDFSQVMVDFMMKRAEEEGIAGYIHPTILAWDDDWSALEVPVCDVAIASRSLATADMQAALEKLDAMARRRVCLTLTTGLSPKVDAVLLEAIGRKPPRYPDCVFAFNILWGMGIEPEVSYIRSARPNEFASFDEAIEKSCDALGTTDEEHELLVSYSRQHLLQTRDRAGTPCWEYDHERVTSWAFLAWDK